MAISYNGLLKKLQVRGTKLYLRKNGVSASVIDKIEKGTGGLDARTIDKLCKLLCCQPGDLMEYERDQKTD